MRGDDSSSTRIGCVRLSVVEHRPQKLRQRLSASIRSRPETHQENRTTHIAGFHAFSLSIKIPVITARWQKKRGDVQLGTHAFQAAKPWPFGLFRFREDFSQPAGQRRCVPRADFWDVSVGFEQSAVMSGLVRLAPGFVKFGETANGQPGLPVVRQTSLQFSVGGQQLFFGFPIPSEFGQARSHSIFVTDHIQMIRAEQGRSPVDRFLNLFVGAP